MKKIVLLIIAFFAIVPFSEAQDLEKMYEKELDKQDSLISIRDSLKQKVIEMGKTYSLNKNKYIDEIDQYNQLFEKKESLTRKNDSIATLIGKVTTEQEKQKLDLEKQVSELKRNNSTKESRKNSIDSKLNAEMVEQAFLFPIERRYSQSSMDEKRQWMYELGIWDNSKYSTIRKKYEPLWNKYKTWNSDVIKYLFKVKNSNPSTYDFHKLKSQLLRVSYYETYFNRDNGSSIPYLDDVIYDLEKIFDGKTPYKEAKIDKMIDKLVPKGENRDDYNTSKPVITETKTFTQEEETSYINDRIINDESGRLVYLVGPNDSWQKIFDYVKEKRKLVINAQIIDKLNGNYYHNNSIAPKSGDQIVIRE